MQDYNAILQTVYLRLGKGVTSSLQLNRVGKQMIGTSFLGSFPQDMAPRNVKKGQSFVLNLDTRKQKGSHWCGVYYNGCKFHVYDSFGRASSRILPIFIKKVGYLYADADKDAEQKIKQNDCGQRSLAWLMFVQKHGIAKAMKI
jgi:hypothetical protein